MTILWRRDFLRTSLAAWTSSQLPNISRGNDSTPERERLPVALLTTAYYPVSHADVIGTKLIEGFRHDGGSGPALKVTSMYVEQNHKHDMSRQLAEKHGIRLCKTIDEAITLGTDSVQVAGVVSLAEHGDYPLDPVTHQKFYPRRRFFDETVAAFQRCGQVVPFFNDKHLSYRWEDAIHMVQTARKMHIPFLAGSSLPLTWRLPPIELPRGCEIESALTIGYGPLEDYGFHALETHQCMIESRRGGESGVNSVRAVIGKDIRAAEADGEWSTELFAAARRVAPGHPEDTAEWEPTRVEYENYRLQPAAYLFDHRDGLKSAVVMANGLAVGFSFAAKITGHDAPIATYFKQQVQMPMGHFALLTDAIDETFHRREPVYPVERTLLTTGILDRCMHSMANGGIRYMAPELNFSYQSTDWPYANHAAPRMKMPLD